jgi:hypothetical protein
VLIIGGVVFSMIKRARQRGPQPDPMSPIPVNPPAGGGITGRVPRAVQDGFWVDTTPYRSGDRVRYRYQGPGGTVEDEFVVEPGQGQFIYTGVTPADIALLGLTHMMQEETTRRMYSQPPPIPRQPPRHERRSYPSAY